MLSMSGLLKGYQPPCSEQLLGLSGVTWSLEKYLRTISFGAKQGVCPGRLRWLKCVTNAKYEFQHNDIKFTVKGEWRVYFNDQFQSHVYITHMFISLPQSPPPCNYNIHIANMVAGQNQPTFIRKEWKKSTKIHINMQNICIWYLNNKITRIVGSDVR